EVGFARAERDHVDAATAQLTRFRLHGERRRGGKRLQAIGQHGLAPYGGRPPGYLGGYFSVSRFSAIGGTMPATDVPKLATSLIRREEMYVYFSWGIKKTVSTVLRSFRFISAIWNSYSKSETARIPRTMQSARSRATRSIRSPSKATIRKLLRSDVASSIISSR